MKDFQFGPVRGAAPLRRLHLPPYLLNIRLRNSVGVRTSNTFGSHSCARVLKPVTVMLRMQNIAADRQTV